MEIELNTCDASSVEIQAPISEGVLAQKSNPALSLPNSSHNRRGRFRRTSRGPAYQAERLMQKAHPREERLESKSDRNRIHEEDALLQQASNGDQEALGNLLASHMPKLYRIALRILDMPQDAEDALQEGLIQVVLHFRKFEGRSRFSTWLTRIVINASLMRLRRRRREIQTSIDQPLTRDEQSLAASITDPRPDPEQVYAREERFQFLQRKMQTLPAASRSAVWLRHVQGMSTREAAEALGLPIGSVKSQLHRARHRLIREVGVVGGVDRKFRSARSQAAATPHGPTGEMAQKEIGQPAA